MASITHSCDADKGASIRWLWQHLHSESEFTVLVIQDQVITTRVKIMGKDVP